MGGARALDSGACLLVVCHAQGSSMARISIGPGSAVIIGLSIVIGSGNGDKLVPIAQTAYGAFSGFKNQLTPIGDSAGMSLLLQCVRGRV